MNARKKYRRFVCTLLAISVIGLAYCSWEALRTMIPEQIQVSSATETPELFQSALAPFIVVERTEVSDNSGEADTSGKSGVSGETGTSERSDVSGEADASGKSGVSGETDALEKSGVSGEKNSTGQTDTSGRSKESGREQGGSDSAESLSVEKSVKEGDAADVSSADVYGVEDAVMEYELSCSLFGKIPLKTVSVSVVPRKTVYAGGTPIGIYMKTDGVLVVDTGEVKNQDGKECCPAENIVKSGDYIQAVNGEEVSTKEELIACIGKCDGSDVVLDVMRDGEEISLKLTPVLDEEGSYRAGIWVRNDTQGIGTLTYLDEEGNFGALGHGISDIDTGELLEIEEGVLYDAEVISVVKGEQGTPGELTGVIHYSEGYRIGTITENRKNGIYGSVTGLPALTEGSTLYEAAHRQEVEEGPAVILCTVDGECREYEVEIREVRLNGSDVNKGMILEVTDQELLEKTGGIVQGMSGSPIIQNGRIVGAVTHVLVNDPTRGYGIFIENMLEHN